MKTNSISVALSVALFSLLAAPARTAEPKVEETVVGPVGGVSEAVVDGVTGLLVPPHHPAQLTAAFEKLISEEPLRRRLGTAGRDWARRNRWEHSANLLFNPNEQSVAPF